MSCRSDVLFKNVDAALEFWVIILRQSSSLVRAPLRSPVFIGQAIERFFGDLRGTFFLCRVGIAFLFADLVKQRVDSLGSELAHVSLNEQTLNLKIRDVA